jgi:alpha-tubulin suppressor-like RCC1 family protein
MNTPHRIGGAMAGLLLFTAMLWLPAADFRIDDVRWQNGHAEVSIAKEPAFYYILWRGDQPTEIRLVTDLALGSVPPNSLADTNATNASHFYRVEKVPMTSLRDSDGDGINDAWELLYRHPGAALNPSDANEDHTGNGVPDWIDALRESSGTGVRGRPLVAGGTYHSLAVKTDGTLWGWGDNLAGQLGSSAFTEANSPTQIGTDTNWSAASIGGLTSYGLKSDGTLWVWGQTTTGNVFSPTQVGTNTNWIGLPKGRAANNPTALQADGTRWQFVSSFTNAQPLGSNDWAAVADDYGSGHWAITSDGTLWNGLSTFDTNGVWASISLGLYHALALRSDGTLWAWVAGCCSPAADGQLGLGSAQPYSPTRVGSDAWAAVAAGLYHSVGIKSDGSLWWWGFNNGFEPSGAGFVRTNMPARIGTNTDWIAVSAGDAHTVALRADGTVWTFGYNEMGKLGNGTIALVKQPTQVGSDQDWSTIAIGNLFSFGLKSNGTLWAWGANPYGVQGVGSFSYSPVPRQVPGSNWIAVSGGGDHSTALQNDGSLWVWGKYIYDNSIAGVFTNLPTRMGTDSDWVKVSAGWQHSLVMKANRSLWAWGRNVRGELGNGMMFDTQNSPVQVSGFGSWTNFSAGYYASLGVRNSALYRWGGEIGSGGIPNYSSPQQIGGDFTWRSVANAKSHISSSHALALKHDGTLWAWGSSFRGQLGINNSSGQPVQVGISTNWSQIAVGDLFSGALQADGTIWMTGFNFYGQLGFGTRADTNFFTQVGGETNWTIVAAGYRHTLALKASGSIWAWGDNSYGQCAQPALFEPAPVPGTNWGKPH